METTSSEVSNRRKNSRKSPTVNCEQEEKKINDSSSNQVVQELCDKLRHQITHDLNNQLTLSLSDAVERILTRSGPSKMEKSFLWPSQPPRAETNHQPRETEKWLPEKEFQHRNSVLTELFQISHIETVYHIFVAILIIFSVNTMLSDWVEKGGIIHTYHIELFLWFFTGIYDVVNCWLTMLLSSSLLVYITFTFWATRRRQSATCDYFDWLFAGLYILHQVALAVCPPIFILTHEIAPASTLIIALEQIRLMMKIHAFVRTNAEKAFMAPKEVTKEIKNEEQRRRLNANERFPSVSLDNSKPFTDDELSMSNGSYLPPLSCYIYFLFAPTLVYRNSYPRTPYVRWRIVSINFFQVGLCILFNYYIFARFCFAHFQNFGRSPHFHFSLRQLVVSSFGCMLPGAMFLLISFYAFLHCWLNAFAEMMRFGDRLFYKDWWNSFTFSAYYRGWNVVVQDWLYTYVYRDVYAVCNSRWRRFVAQTTVFMLSALVHEYTLIVVFRFFYPVLFFIFGVAGFGISHIKGRSRFWNIGLWVALFLGMGILMCLYSMEWYARMNCPPTPGGLIIDAIAPRSWFCGK